MTELNQFVQLRHAYDCGLLLARSLDHLRYGLWLYQDEIALERLFSGKALVTFAGHADRLLTNFAKTSEYALERLRAFEDFNFAEFTANLSAAIREHHEKITLALCPHDGDVATARSKWLNDGAVQKDSQKLLDTSREHAITAEHELYKLHSYLADTVLDAVAHELDHLAKQLELVVVVQRCDKPESYVHSYSEERSDG